MTTVTPQGISVQAAYRWFRDGRLMVNRQYQRKLVWTVSEKQRLIDSILQGYPLPLFLFAERPAKSSGETVLEVIDGMQRLNAIFGFIENTFGGTGARELEGLAVMGSRRSEDASWHLGTMCDQSWAASALPRS